MIRHLTFALSVLACPVAAQVAQGPKNVPEFSPAFENQTRAPEIRDGTQLNTEVIARGLSHPWGVEVLPDGSGVILGGYFWQVNGEYRPNLVLLDRDGQRIAGWRGRPDGPVFDTVIANGVLYIAGFFDQVNDVDQAALAGINLSDGELSTEMGLEIAVPRYKEFRGRLEMLKMDVSPDGSTLVALGNFTRVDGLVRDQVLVVDLTTSPDSIANWSTAYYDHPCDKFDTIWPYILTVFELFQI